MRATGPSRQRLAQETAQRFRDYADLCRARAKNPIWSAEQREAIRLHAERWDRDADLVLCEAYLIERSRELVAQIRDLLAVPSVRP